MTNAADAVATDIWAMEMEMLRMLQKLQVLRELHVLQSEGYVDWRL